MKKNYLILTIVAVVVLVAILTNPNQDRHKETVKNKFNSYMQKSMEESLSETDNEWEQAGQALGIILGGVFVDQIVSTDNYVLFSTTIINWEGETRIIGIGAFGNVFLTNKLDEAMSEGLLEN